MVNPYFKKLVAHRGYPQAYPENSLAGIEAAAQAGAVFIEVDIQLTRNSIPVLFHDRDLKRLCHHDGAMHDYEWKQVKGFRLYSPDSQIQTTAPVASLEQLVELISRYPEITFFIELKRISLTNFGEEVMIECIRHMLKPVQEQCVLISYSLPALEYIRINSRFSIGVVMDQWKDITLNRLNKEMLKKLKPEYVFCDIDSLPEDGDLAFNNTRLAVYECVDPERAIHVLKRGVELVETFAVVEMAKGLNRHE
ncbi:MAG: glycerophosphodiester phosphodiesterase family protein [Gammaproteobacteria bacterium]|nr:glycerophosphodiester phosphodiesterase family protein [Gammaproteobacteria bacterium]